MINILSVDDIYRDCVRNSHLNFEAELTICTNSLSYNDDDDSTGDYYSFKMAVFMLETLKSSSVKTGGTKVYFSEKRTRLYSRKTLDTS